MLNLIREFLRNENGSTAIEYSLMAGGISLAIIAGVNSVGVVVLSKFVSMHQVLQ
jgi:pilus assembly protein Flp/PilA